jgi:cytochrome c oxidase cbb3-type subunit 3
MSGIEGEKALDHEYDGIREYDNPLPGWWVFLFWATIVYSLFYATYYHFGNGPTVLAEYDANMLAIAELQSKEALSAGPVTDATLLGFVSNQGMMLGARQLYMSKCAVCHGAAGEGKIGPNLTDDFWLHGSRPTQIHHTLVEGVTEKGMIAWKTQLRPGEIAALAAYVTTLHGTNPPNPKPPQGDPAPAPADAALPEAAPAGAGAGGP